MIKVDSNIFNNKSTQMILKLQFYKHTLMFFLERLVLLSHIGNRKYIFIALIHPIQWTIALPVGATGPAKRQKKTSCI